ncbi:hypothetical protein F5887DRAFT_969964 [Amanita rubescens]|nr:hypothetical protein F5887DRAFT_969964 [Amanita rubescens]
MIRVRLVLPQELHAMRHFIIATLFIAIFSAVCAFPVTQVCLSPGGPEPELPKQTNFNTLDRVWNDWERKTGKKFIDKIGKEEVLPLGNEELPNALMKRILDADHRAAGAEVLALAKLYNPNHVGWGCEGSTCYIVVKTDPGLDFFTKSSSNSMTTSGLRSKFKEDHSHKEIEWKDGLTNWIYHRSIHGTGVYYI